MYSRNSIVELVLNDRLIARKDAGKANKYIASFEFIYEPGELLAIGYDNGIEVSRALLKTAGPPAFIRLTPDRSELHASFGDLSYIAVELLDSEENIVHDSKNTIFYTVSGEGTLLAVGNGNPISEEMYTGNFRKVHEGKAMIVVRANGNQGEIQVTAATDGVPTITITLKVI